MSEASVRERLVDGDTVVGTWCNTASPIVAELLAGLGFDFVAVDAEHSSVDLPTAEELFRAVDAGSRRAEGPCAPLVRLPDTAYETVKRYLDAGARGVIAPLVNSPEEAERVVAATNYPPDGDRGVGFARSNAYGTAFDAHVPADNETTLVCVQIEHVDAVEQVDDILAVDGVDAAFLGPYDLSASMDLTGQFDHPDVVAAVDRVREACLDHGVAPGVHVVEPDPEEARDYLDEGYRMLGYSLDTTMLAATAETGLDALPVGHDDGT